MTVKQITQSVKKSDTEKSKVLKVLIHYFVILSISFSFTIIAIRHSDEKSDRVYQKCESAEVERIVGQFLKKSDIIQKVDVSREKREFGYLHKDQENDAPRKRVKKNVELEDKGFLKMNILIEMWNVRG